MTPQVANPNSRKIEVDLSAILVGRKETGPIQMSQAPDCAVSTVSVRSVDRREMGIGSFGWTNINFVAVCVVVAMFCVLFIRDSFEYSRRPVHLAADASDFKPQFSSIMSPDFSSESSARDATIQSGGSKTSWLVEKSELSNRSEEWSSSPQFRQDPTLASAPNSNRPVTESPSNFRSVSSSTDSQAGPSRTSASSTESFRSSSTEGRTTSTRLSTQRLTSVAGSRHNLRRSLANAVRNPAVHNSVPHAARQNAVSLSTNAHIEQSRSAKTPIANGPGLMSMHTLGSSGVGQIHGPVNSMRMEGGMLAQPGIGAGLGGISNNGLGGGGIRGGNRVAK
jgi:hypothetical protein